MDFNVMERMCLDELARRKRPKKTLTITENDTIKIMTLPDYGEVRIVCHDGKVKFIETTVKEQI